MFLSNNPLSGDINLSNLPCFFRKKGYINFVSKSVRLPSVCSCVRPSVMFLVNLSPPKLLEVATSNFLGE